MMRLKTIIFYAVITTTICIVYVSQQVSIVTLGYQLRVKENKLCELVDRNRVLLYNNTSLKAPQYLAGRLRENDIDLKLPDTGSVAKIRIVRHDRTEVAKATTTGWRTRLFDIIVPKAQAALDSIR
ncbi:MAG: hypothetical protein GY853_04020 [PVC group bacterium]|nr:hypothetical protein [PVC group bacterium]